MSSSLLVALCLVSLAVAASAQRPAYDSYRRHRLTARDEQNGEGTTPESHSAGHRLRGRPRHYLKRLIKLGYEQWRLFKDEHNKTYESEAQENDRMISFLSNLEEIKVHNDFYNRGEKSFGMGVSWITDLPFEEYKKLNGYRRLFGDDTPKNASRFLAPFNAEVPDEWDWREHGLVAEVKNQGMCGSCYAFSAIGSLEGQHRRQTGKMTSLSEQNIVDCSRKYGNNGCNGGLMDYAFEYIKDNHGVDTETSYPYKGVESKCHFNKKTVGAEDTGYVDLPEGDEEQLKVAVATQGPISVAIDAGHRSFQLYKKGVYFEKECSPENLDHGVLVVGYGTDDEDGDYWLIKNSWGESWGEQGYMRMARNKHNHCGVASKASYPLV